MKETILEALYQKLQQNGYRVNKTEAVSEIFYMNDFLCKVTEEDKIVCKPNGYSEQIQWITSQYRLLKESYQQFQNADYLSFSELQDYKILCQFSNAVLAAKQSDNHQLHFVTWVYNDDRDGLAFGHYFMEDYEHAKEDFAVRGGLVEKEKLLSDEMLLSLYKSASYQVWNDYSISIEEEKYIKETLSHIENLIPKECSKLSVQFNGNTEYESNSRDEELEEYEME